MAPALFLQRNGAQTLSVILMWGLSVAFLASTPLAKNNLESLIASDGRNPNDARIEEIVWHRANRFSGAATTVSLVSGEHRLYAVGDVTSDSIDIEVIDKGTGESLGRFVLDGRLPAKPATLVVKAPSICLVTVRPAKIVHARRVKSYSVAIGIVRQQP